MNFLYTKQTDRLDVPNGEQGSSLQTKQMIHGFIHSGVMAPWSNCLSWYHSYIWNSDSTNDLYVSFSGHEYNDDLDVFEILASPVSSQPRYFEHWVLCLRANSDSSQTTCVDRWSKNICIPRLSASGSSVCLKCSPIFRWKKRDINSLLWNPLVLLIVFFIQEKKMIRKTKPKTMSYVIAEERTWVGRCSTTESGMTALCEREPHEQRLERQTEGQRAAGKLRHDV